MKIHSKTGTVSMTWSDDVPLKYAKCIKSLLQRQPRYTDSKMVKRM